MKFPWQLRSRIVQLEESLEQQQRLLNINNTSWVESAEKLRVAQNQIEYLVRTIRDIDQEIYNMGQKTDWASQRPHFLKLHDEMTARKVTESKRIGDVLRGELIDTYKPQPGGLTTIGKYK